MKKQYTKPEIKMMIIYHEESIAASSIECERSNITHYWEEEETETRTFNWDSL